MNVPREASRPAARERWNGEGTCEAIARAAFYREAGRGVSRRPGGGREDDLTATPRGHASGRECGESTPGRGRGKPSRVASRVHRGG
ncbi:MAG: hypothetical protein LBF09_04725 [Odoribacteraceae bacterium]|nr:hypothetical protein [Odoribacteraceae bacterium]